MNTTHATPSSVRTLALAAGLCCASAASAETGDVSVGIGAALAMDLPDPASTTTTTRFGPGPSLQIPVRLAVAPNASLRINARADLGTGKDRVTWARHIDGEPVRFFAEDQFAMFVAGGITAGPEVILPVDGPVRPYIGAGAGAAWVGTYHSLGEDGQHLRDPAGSGADPYTSQIAFLTDVTVGGTTGGKTAFWFELGYSNAWVGAKALTRAVPDLDARREAYGWNAGRAGLGVAFSL